MKAEQVDQALIQKFVTENERLVFWHDSNAEFQAYITLGLPKELESVTVIDVAKKGGFSTKLLLEREDPTGKYLLYSVGKPLPPEEDWLLDVRMYSAEFHADVASLWIQELGLSGLHLREHLRARSTFLANQDRRKKLKRLIASSDDEAAIDLKMMAVLAGSEVADLLSILRALCHGHLTADGFDLNEPPKVLGLFEKMDLATRFWEMVRRDFGYTRDNPSVAGLLRSLFVSELSHQTGGVRIDAIAHFELPPKGRQNAVVCLTQWRDSREMAASYDAASDAVARELNLAKQLESLSLESLAEVFTFWAVEKRVVSELKTRVMEEAQSIDADAIAALAATRMAGHWLAGPAGELPERMAVAGAYDAIVAAAELFSLRTEYQRALSFESPEALLSAYRNDLYRFDQLYRWFCVGARAAQRQGWNLLKSLSTEVEQVYSNGFLQPLGLEWGRLLDDGFLGSWKLSEMLSQQSFFAKSIRSYLREADRKRAYVIISDAFRYEAAQELVEKLNGRYRMDASLTAMLGVLPSYTALGMASLLPHESLEYDDKGEVLVDGKAVAGTEARSRQLASVEGMACQARELLVKKTDEAREFTRGMRVVYIYHNVIDARGDTASTEGETFAAVDECISELVELVQFCVNKLNAATVWVTADHGFLFQQEPPELTDKSQLSQKLEHAVKTKKRYVIGRGLGSVPEAHHGSTKVTAGTSDAMEFWIPRGTNRFHFTGGARFVHGGAMPQEIVVPLVTVTQLRGKRIEGSGSEKVSVQVLGTTHKITTPSYRFELIQTEAVSERRHPINLRAAVYDGDRAVTSVATVTFESESDSLADRKKSIRLELKTGEYDKAKPYRLVLRDAETDAEVQSVQVQIDRSFDDDF
jgi:uncharacterized protein (TIGR02687 family)